MNLQEYVSLKPYNTFGIDATARYFASYKNKDELIDILSSSIATSNSILQIGGGSNLLFLGNFDGLILHSNIKYITKTDENEKTVTLSVGAGVVWDEFVAYCVINNYYGVENLSHIPGVVGAAAVQNIGAYGMEVKDAIREVKGIYLNTDKKEFRFTKDECYYGYRSSIFKNELKGKVIITEVDFTLMKTPTFVLNYSHLKECVLKNGKISLNNVRNTIIQMRDAKLPDPQQIGNAGSFFMNPIIPKEQYETLLTEYPDMHHYPIDENNVKVPAGWLIEHCGLRGKRFEQVGIYEKQALVIVNLGNASGSDIAHVAELVQLTVKKKFGITIVPEVTYVE